MYVHPKASRLATVPPMRGGEGHRSRGAVFATVAFAIALAIAPAATAEKFKGRFDGGKNVTLITNQRDQVRVIFFSRWKADCNDGKLRLSTGFQRPLDRSSRRSFRDVGPLTVKPRGSKVKIKVRQRVRGKRVSATRWKGTFDASAVIKQGGKRIDRCRMPKRRWSVNRVGGGKGKRQSAPAGLYSAAG